MPNLQTCSARDASTYLGNPCQTSWYLQLDFFLPPLQSEYLLLEFITATFYTDYKRNILHSAHHEHSEFVSLLQQSMLSGKTAAIFLVTLLFCGQRLLISFPPAVSSDRVNSFPNGYLQNEAFSCNAVGNTDLV